MLCQPDIWAGLSELPRIFPDKAMCPQGVLGFPWDDFFFFPWKVAYEMSGIWRGLQVPAACLGGELHLSCADFMDHPAHRDHVATLVVPAHLTVWD